jgi:hypothetical protein
MNEYEKRLKVLVPFESEVRGSGFRCGSDAARKSKRSPFALNMRRARESFETECEYCGRLYPLTYICGHCGGCRSCCGCYER